MSKTTQQATATMARPVYYAAGVDGIPLPIVDLSNPVFQCHFAPPELEQIQRDSMENWERGRHTPRLLLKLIARRSILMRGTLEAARGNLSGMATYFQKMGPELLKTPLAGKLDHKLVNFIGPICMRLRLQTIARFLADDLARATNLLPPSPIWLLNIGGGAASDTLNALILLVQERPESLRRRRINIRVLDTDDDAPQFGGRCLEALQSPAAPLAGLDIDYRVLHYDWVGSFRLREWLQSWQVDQSIVVASSEGALFEYGDDEDIVANLERLRQHTPAAATMVGSIFRDDDFTRTVKRLARFNIRPRNLMSFEALARRAGWLITRHDDANPMTIVVALAKA